MPTTDIHLEFPDERSRNDFEIRFRGFMSEWQTQQATLRRLALSTADPDDITKTSDAAPVPSEPHHLGMDPDTAEIGEIDITITIGDTTIPIGPIYLNVIAGW